MSIRREHLKLGGLYLMKNGEVWRPKAFFPSMFGCRIVYERCDRLGRPREDGNRSCSLRRLEKDAVAGWEVR